MVIIVPTDDHRGLLHLGHALGMEQGGDPHSNIMDKIFKELQTAKDEFDHEIKLTMPEFKIKTDVDVVDNLQKVRQPYFWFDI